MARLTPANVAVAHKIISRYPRKRSALIPLLHLAQSQDGYVTNDAMAHIAELVDVTPAEVLGTCSFYEMFKREPVGRYVLNVCTNISCMLVGGYEVLDHLTAKLDTPVGSTTDDGLFTIEEAECLAACTEAPCLQVNYRYVGNVTTADVDELIEGLRAGRLTDTYPDHGTLSRVRQDLGAAPAGAASGEGDA